MRRRTRWLTFQTTQRGRARNHLGEEASMGEETRRSEMEAADRDDRGLRKRWRGRLPFRGQRNAAALCKIKLLKMKTEFAQRSVRHNNRRLCDRNRKPGAYPLTFQGTKAGATATIHVLGPRVPSFGTYACERATANKLTQRRCTSPPTTPRIAV